VSFATVTLCVASQRVFIVTAVYFVMTQSGNFWIHPCTVMSPKLTTQSSVFLENLTVAHLGKKFPASYRTSRFSVVHIFEPCFLKMHPSVPKFSEHSLLFKFPTKIVYAFPISPMCAVHLTHPILNDLITIIIRGEGYKLWSSSLCKFMKPAVVSCLLCSDIPLAFRFPIPSFHALPLVRECFTPIQIMTLHSDGTILTRQLTVLTRSHLRHDTQWDEPKAASTFMNGAKLQFLCWSIPPHGLTRAENTDLNELNSSYTYRILNCNTFTSLLPVSVTKIKV